MSKISFNGDGKEFFGIWIVNTLLSIVTLGIYSPWAKVQNTKYLYNNLSIDDHYFDYHAQPIQILKGRLIAILAVIAFALLSTVNEMKALTKNGKINLFTKYQLKSIKGSEKLESINIEHDNKELKTLKTDYVLGFFGLIMQLGPIANWGLNLDKKTIKVDTEKFETNQKGIYAVGDICHYPGKLKLILSGFHEGALAARACFKLAKPNEKYRFEFTTSSKTIKDRLGKKND